jgi:hypothetical protein
MDLWTPPLAADERAIAAALREYDPELRLVPQESDAYGCTIYHVRRWAGNDRPSEFLFAWVTETGEALPLSHRLLDLVREHDRNLRAQRLDADAKNELKRQEDKRHWDSEMEALSGDWEMKHGRPVLPRSQSLRMSRDKRRARGEKA